MLDAELFVICAYPFRDDAARQEGQHFRAASRVDAQPVLDQARDLVGRAERATFVAVPSSNPARALHEVAEGEDAQLIVVGSRSAPRVARARPRRRGRSCATPAARSPSRRTDGGSASGR